MLINELMIQPLPTNRANTHTHAHINLHGSVGIRGASVVITEQGVRRKRKKMAEVTFQQRYPRGGSPERAALGKDSILRAHLRLAWWLSPHLPHQHPRNQLGTDVSTPSRGQTGAGA